MHQRAKGVVLCADDKPAASSALALLIANRPIISHVLEGLASAGVEEVAIVASAEGIAQIRPVVEADAEAPTPSYLVRRGQGLLALLAAAAAFVGNAPCVLQRGDGVAGPPPTRFIDLLRAQRPDLMVLTHRGPDDCERLDRALARLPGGAAIARGPRLGLAGLCALGPGAFALLCGPHSPRQAAGASARSAAPSTPESDLGAILNRLAAGGGSLQVERLGAWHRYRGRTLDLIEMNRIVLDRMPWEADIPEPGDNRIEGRVRIEPGAQISASVVVGPTVIGAHARIIASAIGPYTSVGPRAHIEGSEVSSSIILEGARIMYVGERIEDSMIGGGARITRDLALPRAMRLHVPGGSEVSLP